MEKFETTELIELVPTNVIENCKLTKKQTLLLGLFIVYSNLEQTKNNGYFYRSNKDICSDIEISEPTLITSLTKLEKMGIIERKAGKRAQGASEYKVNDSIFNTKINTKNLSDNLSINLSDDLSINSSEIIDIIRVYNNNMNLLLKLLLKSNIKNLSDNLSTDTESDIDKEIDIDNNIYNKINNIKETINNNLNKINNNILNISESGVTTENEVEDNEEKINEYQVEEEINVEPVTVDDELDDTNTLTDEQLEEKLTNYFNEQKDTITNEHQLNEFETVFNMVLQNFQDNEQITKEQFSHANLFIVQPLLSQLRGKVYTNIEEKVSTEPSKEETLTTTQPIKENVSETKEMALNENEETGTPTEDGLVSVFEEMVKEERAPKKSSYKEGELDCEQALELLKPRMYELYAQATSLAELNEKYKQIVDGLQKWLEEGKINQVAFGCIKTRAWQISNDFGKKLYNIPS